VGIFSLLDHFSQHYTATKFFATQLWTVTSEQAKVAVSKTRIQTYWVMRNCPIAYGVDCCRYLYFAFL